MYSLILIISTVLLLILKIIGCAGGSIQYTSTIISIDGIINTVDGIINTVDGIINTVDGTINTVDGIINRHPLLYR